LLVRPPPAQSRQTNRDAFDVFRISQAEKTLPLTWISVAKRRRGRDFSAAPTLTGNLPARCKFDDRPKLRRQIMARGFPSMTALLGLLAIAGYQNRDKIAEIISGLGKGAPAQGGLGGLLGNLGAGGPGGLLGGGLKELVDRFNANGQGDAVNSWVGTGENKSISEDQMKTAIGADTLATLSKETGLSESELLARLSRALPDAVDKYTPDGRLPA
jgi:uncharacterized protein YidB (DUF937 family)